MASVTSAAVQRASGPNGAAEGPTLGSAPDTMMLTVEVRAPVHLMRFLAELRREAHLSLLRVECDRKELVQIRLSAEGVRAVRPSRLSLRGRGDTHSRLLHAGPTRRWRRRRPPH